MLAELKPHLDERQWRLTLGAQARALGPGGIGRVAALTKSHPDTVSRGARELEQGIEPGGRVRQAGAGRPSATDLDPGLVDALRKLVEPETRGDPMQPLVWTTKSTGNLAGELGKAGRPVSADTVGRLLRGRLGYSLQGNAKTIEGKQHPDRDAQFGYLCRPPDYADLWLGRRRLCWPGMGWWDGQVGIIRVLHRPSRKDSSGSGGR